MTSVTEWYTVAVSGTWTNNANAWDNDVEYPGTPTTAATTVTAGATTIGGPDSALANFDDIPTGATIEGIVVKIYAGGDSDDYLQVALSYDGTNFTSNKTLTPGSAGWDDVGDATDTWGRTWSQSEINTSNFKCRIIYQNSTKANTMSLYYVSVTVYYNTYASKTLQPLYKILHRIDEVPIDTDARLVLHLDEGTGSTAYDSSSYGNDAVVPDTQVDWSSDSKYGSYSLYYDSNTYDDKVSIADDASLQITGDLTMAMWVKLISYGGTIGCFLLNKNNGTGYMRCYCLSIATAEGTLAFIRGNGTSALDETKSTNVVPLGSWVFLTVTCESKEVKIYINGVLDATGSYTLDPTPASGYPVVVGGMNGYSNAERYVNGRIDEVYLFSRALSQSEITNLMNNNRNKYLTNKYSILGAVSKGVGLLYTIYTEVLEAVSKMVTLNYTIYAYTAIAKSVALVYNIYSYVTETVQSRYSILGNITKSASILYNIAITEGIIKSVGLLYSVRKSTDQTDITLYDQCNDTFGFHSNIAKYGNQYFCIFEGEDKDPTIVKFDGSEWSDPEWLWDNPLDEGHYAPSISIDDDGYLHITAAGSGSPLTYKRSTNPLDITDWTNRTSALGVSAASYPMPYCVPGTDTVYIFYSLHGAAGKYYKKSTDGGATWGSAQLYYTYNSPLLMYTVWNGPWTQEVDGHWRIYYWACLHDYGDYLRHDAFYFYFDTYDDHFYSVDGTDLGTSLTNTELDTYCKTLDTGTLKCYIGNTVHAPDGTPMVINCYEYSAGNYKFSSWEWDGDSWTNQRDIVTVSEYFNISVVAIPHGTDKVWAFIDVSAPNYSLYEYDTTTKTWSFVRYVLTDRDIYHAGKKWQRGMRGVTPNVLCFMVEEYWEPLDDDSSLVLFEITASGELSIVKHYPRITPVYSIRNYTSSTKSILYSILAGGEISRSFTFLYSIRNYTDRTNLFLYSIRNLSSSTKNLLYSIRNSASSSKTVLYSIRGLASSTMGLLYSIRNYAPSTKTVLYSIRNHASSTKSLLYKILTTTSTTKILNYQIRNLSSKSVQLLYDLYAGLAITTVQFKYHILGAVSTTKNLRYHILSAISTTKGILYSLRNYVSSEKRVLYKILSFVSSSKGVLYSIRNFVSKTSTELYKILASVSTSKAFNYQIRMFSAVSKTISYSMRSFVSSTKNILYNILSSISYAYKDVRILYSVRNFASTTKAFRYSILSFLSSTKSFSYSILSYLSVPKTVLYSIRNSASSSKTILYSIRTFSSASKTINYSIRNFTQTSKKIIYSILGTVGETVSLLYGIRNFVSTKTTNLLYDIRNFVAESKIVQYSILGPVTKTHEILYDISAFLALIITTKILYNIGNVWRGVDPFYHFRDEVYDYLEGETGVGGELEGFVIYKYRPTRTPMFFPCIVMDIQRSGIEEDFGVELNYGADLIVEAIFKKDHSVYLDSRQLILMRRDLARYYRGKLISLMKAFQPTRVKIQNTEITGTTYAPLKPKQSLYGTRVVYHVTFEGGEDWEDSAD